MSLLQKQLLNRAPEIQRQKPKIVKLAHEPSSKKLKLSPLSIGIATLSTTLLLGWGAFYLGKLAALRAKRLATPVTLAMPPSTVIEKTVLASHLSENGEALRFLNEGNIDGAKKNFTHLLSEFPESAVLLSNLAIAEAKSGKIIDGIAFYKQLIQREPDNSIALNNYATLLMEQKEYAEAVRLLEKANLLNPSTPDLLLNLGKAQELSLEWSKARQTFLKYIDHSAGDPLIKKLLIKRAGKLNSLAHIANLDKEKSR